MRTRMSVTPSTKVESIITDTRKALGFDQSWIAESDFKLYSRTGPRTQPRRAASTTTQLRALWMQA